MILDLTYTNRDLYTFNQVRFRLTYLSGLGATGFYTRGFGHLVNALIDKADIRTR